MLKSNDGNTIFNLNTGELAMKNAIITNVK